MSGGLYDAQALADMFAPALNFYYYQDCKEHFKPVGVECMLDNACLNWGYIDKDTLIKAPPLDPEDINGFDEFYVLDIACNGWRRSDFDECLIGLDDPYPNKIFAHVTTDTAEDPDTGGNKEYIAIQYWFFYIYNDWTPDPWPHKYWHEGDWETVTILLDQNNLEPEWIGFSQHIYLPFISEGGKKCKWERDSEWLEIVDGTHPRVYVALSSHANYPKAGYWRIGGIEVKDLRLDHFDLTKAGLDHIWRPVELLNDQPWLTYEGGWGVGGIITESPGGPSFQIEKWNTPAQWVMELSNINESDFKPDGTFVTVCCPADTLITNVRGERLGTVNGEFVNEISGALINSDGDRDIYLLPYTEKFSVKVTGTGDGQFSLTIEEFTEDSSDVITATLPISQDMTYLFEYDMDKVQAGKDGVDISIDFDGDGTFDYFGKGGAEIGEDDIDWPPEYNAYIVSSDASGAEKDTFDLSESVHCYGGNLPASTPVDIYVVNNKDDWEEGDALTDVSGGYETVTTGDDGSISTTLIWSSPLTQGSYDIVVDTNRNGEWNEGEPIDSWTTTGFEAIPEFTTIAIPVVAIIGLMFLLSRRKRKKEVV